MDTIPQPEGTTYEFTRWGDYVTATPDPTNPSVVWGTSMTIDPLGAYASRNFALRPRP